MLHSCSFPGCHGAGRGLNYAQVYIEFGFCLDLDGAVVCSLSMKEVMNPEIFTSPFGFTCQNHPSTSTGLTFQGFSVLKFSTILPLFQALPIFTPSSVSVSV